MNPLLAALVGYVVARELVARRRSTSAALKLDARGIPTAACPSCGFLLLRVLATFDPETYEVATYALDGECADCGALVTVPTPLDVIA